jgi:hypothetical protein
MSVHLYEYNIWRIAKPGLRNFYIAEILQIKCRNISIFIKMGQFYVKMYLRSWAQAPWDPSLRVIIFRYVSVANASEVQ